MLLYCYVHEVTVNWNLIIVDINYSCGQINEYTSGLILTEATVVGHSLTHFSQQMVLLDLFF